MALGVRSVCAGSAVEARAFVKADAEEPQTVDDDIHRALHETLVIGVLNAQEEFSAALMGQTLVHKRAVKISQMDESGRLGPILVTMAPSGSSLCGYMT